MAVLASGLTFARAVLAPAAPARRCTMLPSAAGTAACEASQVAVADRCARPCCITRAGTLPQTVRG